MKILSKVIFSIGILFLVVCPVVAEEQDSLSLDTTTVTAQKREEKIQKVPVSITAFTQIELEDAGVESIADVIDMIPNMTMDSGIMGLSNVNIRGIGSSTFTGKNPVIIYLDGVPVDTVKHSDIEMFDIERVEVLRGPQGTLYGKNAIGGIINIITQKPDNTAASKITVQAGEDETYAVKTFVNGPIIKDKLFFGVSGKYTETRGFMKNDTPGQDYYDAEENKNFKALLRWLPSDRLEVNLHTGVDLTRDGGSSDIASDEVRYHESRDPDDRCDSDIFNTALNVNYTSGFAKITSITTYRDTETDTQINLSYLNTGYLYNIDNTNSTSVTQELRIQSPKELGAMKWLAGLYYSNEDEDYNDYSNTYDTKSSYGYNVKYNWPGDRGEKTMAVFGQLTIPLFSRLNLTTGLRYETIHKDINYKSQVTRTDTGEKLTSDVEWSRDEDWEALLPKGVFSWDINKDVMVYFSIAQGYLAGGFNGWGDDPDTATFDEQTSWNYEIGAKTAWFNNRLFFNSTLFYIDIDDMHVWSNPSTGIWIASNAAKAHSQGVEIEIKAKPLQGLDITAALGWTDVEFDDYKISDTSDYTGNTPIQTPEYTFNLSAQYRFNTGFFVRMEMEGYGKTYYNEENTLERSPFQLYHAKIGYETSNWEVYLYGNNLSDKKYFSTINNERHTVGSPRTLGVVASVRF